MSASNSELPVIRHPLHPLALLMSGADHDLSAELNPPYPPFDSRRYPGRSALPEIDPISSGVSPSQSRAANDISADAGASAATELRFGPFRLGADGTLMRNWERIALAPKELAILRRLVASEGRIVSSAQLQQWAWEETHVSQDSLPRCISSLRARLGDKRCIATVYKHGYRFNLPVELAALSPASEPILSSPISSMGRSSPKSNEIPNESHPNRFYPQELRRIHALPRLAILPFRASEGVPHGLGTGIAEEIMLRLAQSRESVADLIALDSVLALTARGYSAQEIGLTFNAELALTGSIAAMPIHLRLRVELIQVAGAIQLWMEDFLVPRALPQRTEAGIAERVEERLLNFFASSACLPPQAGEAKQTVPYFGPRVPLGIDMESEQSALAAK